MNAPARPTIGNRLAPARFILFALLLLGAVPAAIFWLGEPLMGIMAGFDAAALAFLAACLPLLRVTEARTMRDDAARNDANRAVLLAITGVVMLAILATVTAEVTSGEDAPATTKAMVIATLLLAWLFSNTIYALHYAHLAYSRGAKALDFPGAGEPVYSDFAYFAFTLGMTFQTSDVQILDRGIRRTVIAHCLAAFIFNIGILAFTISVLGG